MEYTHVVLGDDGFQQITARGDRRMRLLQAGDGFLADFIEILPVGNHHRHVVVGLHHAHFLL